MMTLRERGLPIYDLGDIFKNQKGTIYTDQIHYLSDTDGDSPGNRMVAARIGELLAETWGLQRKPGSDAAGAACCRSDLRPAAGTVR